MFDRLVSFRTFNLGKMNHNGRPEDENMERKILEVAEQLFLEKGYALSSMSEIARRAGCNQALVHYYFRKKEFLFQRIFADKVNLFATSFLNIDKEGDSFLEKFRKRMEFHFDMLWQNRQIPALLLNELYTNPVQMDYVKKVVQDMDKSVFVKFGNELKEEVEAGRIKDMSMVDIIMNALSLNLTTFVMLPMLRQAGIVTDENETEFLEQRKKVIVDTLIASLKR